MSALASLLLLLATPTCPAQYVGDVTAAIVLFFGLCLGCPGPAVAWLYRRGRGRFLESDVLALLRESE